MIPTPAAFYMKKEEAIFPVYLIKKTEHGYHLQTALFQVPEQKPVQFTSVQTAVHRLKYEHTLPKDRSLVNARFRTPETTVQYPGTMYARFG